MPEYFYQNNLNTSDFIKKIDNQIPALDSVVSISSIFCPLIKIDVPATSEEDLDEYMATLGCSRVAPATPPTDQIALAVMQLQIGTGPFSQVITSTDQKADFWNQNTESTTGIITADQFNNEFTIDSVFNTDTGDRYEAVVNASVEVPSSDWCIITIVHNDNTVENIASECKILGQFNGGAISMSLTGTFKVTSAINQSVYINVRTIGANETVEWHAGNILLKRL